MPAVEREEASVLHEVNKGKACWVGSWFPPLPDVLSSLCGRAHPTVQVAHHYHLPTLLESINVVSKLVVSVSNSGGGAERAWGQVHKANKHGAVLAAPAM